MADPVEVFLLAASAFFVVLAFGLLYRYRQVSKTISSSNDLGKDLWQALEARMRKQDERILDMMGRVEVIQSRVTERFIQTGPVMSFPTSALGQVPISAKPEAKEEAATPSPSDIEELEEAEPESQPATSQVTPPEEPKAAESVGAAAEIEARLSRQDERLTDVLNALQAIQSRLPQIRQETPASSVQSRPVENKVPTGGKVDEKVLLQMLAEKPRTSGEIRERFDISREHASRVLKELFVKGLAAENSAHKPYVYELTEAGRKSLA